MSILQKNLAALSVRHAELSKRLAQLRPSSRIRFSASRAGPLYAVIGDDRETALHSRFDPRREASRLVDGSRSSGFCLVLGLGLGYHVRELLCQPQLQLALIVEYDGALLRAILEQQDLSDVWQDSRVQLYVDQAPRAVAAAIAQHYVPVVHGNLSTLLLRGRFDCDRALFSDAGTAASEAAEAAGADLSVQRVFGRQWMRNIITNSLACPVQPALPHCRSAIVSAAGPSLDHRIDAIARRNADQLLIATDTSLPRLLDAGIRPDLVLAIDCQLASYLHVLATSKQQLTLVADAGVYPALRRRFSAVHLIGGGHPLLAYLRAAGVPITWLDTSDGSVTHAAVRLAVQLGAEQVEVYGADFCYPRGSAYARGSYIHSHMIGRARRTVPYASGLYRFVLERPELELDQIDGRWAYTTKVMRHYRHRFTNLQAELGARIVRSIGASPIDSGTAPAGVQDPRCSEPGAHAPLNAASDTAAGNAHSVLVAYRQALAQIPTAHDPLWSYFDQITAAERLLWQTLFPLAAFYSAQSRPVGTAALLEHTRDGALQLLKQLV
ncbi:MAG: DUF115 domain-containing protein [Spirochaetaceae bacterium]|nr:MAG: DUF115 domain-containing protein [Spirochaetaceae bacterium]